MLVLFPSIFFLFVYLHIIGSKIEITDFKWEK